MTCARVRRSTAPLVALLLGLGPGCFAPNIGPGDTDASTSDAGSDSTNASGSVSGSSSGTADASTAVTTMVDPETSTTEVPTTTTPTSGSESSTTEPLPIECGDGILAGEEECDDGDENRLTGACLPNCTLARCGDGNTAPDEACDNGNQNALLLGACAPDCSRFIEAKQIVRSGPLGPNAGPPFLGNPVDVADSACPVGFRALFAFGQDRRATTDGYGVTDPIDWPIQPYTQYQNANGDEVWTTNGERLLGVRNAGPTSLVTRITFGCGAGCDQDPIVTGMNADWTTAANDCLDWGSTNAGISTPTGNPASLTDFLAETTVGCDQTRPFSTYCVEL